MSGSTGGLLVDLGGFGGVEGRLRRGLVRARAEVIGGGLGVALRRVHSNIHELVGALACQGLDGEELAVQRAARAVELRGPDRREDDRRHCEIRLDSREAEQRRGSDGRRRGAAVDSLAWWCGRVNRSSTDTLISQGKRKITLSLRMHRSNPSQARIRIKRPT